eukprot:CAMPEP_0183314010 /NCGR_PEP_ID=MMETSP0160_2-20130417/47210_1 /TAXON_ID=2839 ORGANISM="Odontella Sinensis, Strain Grunow 1884" /NCGR_SAMPLE_ID=MMETSP0160_2 /ASSEMBLY_ACC=CAM_ASM_000250 /LENGTH=121 /DNA_ID=CAMNT_0025479229 /DNA_START=24 /DNA_END=390 /DNA_ORIENTATION=-
MGSMSSSRQSTITSSATHLQSSVCVESDHTECPEVQNGKEAMNAPLATGLALNAAPVSRVHESKASTRAPAASLISECPPPWPGSSPKARRMEPAPPFPPPRIPLLRPALALRRTFFPLLS